MVSIAVNSKMRGDQCMVHCFVVTCKEGGLVGHALEPPMVGDLMAM